MKVISYSQRNGFAEIDQSEIGPEWLKNEERSAWLKRAGYEQWDNDGDGEDNDDNFQDHTKVYVRETGEWRILVIYERSIGWEEFTVRNRADLWSLRVQLASVLTRSMLDRLANLERMAERAFRALHGHDPLRPCSRCDPVAAHEEREWMRQRAARKAKGS